MLPVESSLQSLKSDLLSEKIMKVRVLFVPYNVVTRVRLTPELLTGSAKVNELVDMDHTMRTSLLTALDKTKASQLDSPPDLRWGAIFYDAHGRELHSIYLNGRILFRTGRQGIIDGKLTKLNGALVEWFEERFGKL
jgi:hypothetical protein